MSKNNKKIYDDYKDLESRYYNKLTQEIKQQKGRGEFLKYINEKMGLNKRRSVNDNLKNISSRLAVNKSKKLRDKYNFKKVIEEWQKWNDDNEPEEEEEEEITFERNPNIYVPTLAQQAAEELQRRRK